MAVGVMTAQSPSRAFDRTTVGARAAVGAGDRLDEIFAEPYARMMRWRRDNVQASQAEAQKGMEGLLRERSRLEGLEGDLAAAEQEKENVLKLREETDKLGDHVRRSAEAAARRASGALRTKEKVQEALQECRQRLEREEEALAASRRTAEARSAEVEGLIGLYGERLGLRCSREAPQTVRMVFTLIDPAEPAREFSFSLGLCTSLEYQVLGCSPAVPGLDAMVADLNAEGGSKCALPTFLCGMRRAFRASVVAAAPRDR